MEIKLIQFKHIKNKFYMIITYDNNYVKKYLIQNKYKNLLFDLFCKIMFTGKEFKYGRIKNL